MAHATNAHTPRPIKPARAAIAAARLSLARVALRAARNATKGPR